MEYNRIFEIFKFFEILCHSGIKTLTLWLKWFPFAYQLLEWRY